MLAFVFFFTLLLLGQRPASSLQSSSPSSSSASTTSSGIAHSDGQPALLNSLYFANSFNGFDDDDIFRFRSQSVNNSEYFTYILRTVHDRSDCSNAVFHKAFMLDTCFIDYVTGHDDDVAFNVDDIILSNGQQFQSMHVIVGSSVLHVDNCAYNATADVNTTVLLSQLSVNVCAPYSYAGFHYMDILVNLTEPISSKSISTTSVFNA